MKFTPKLKILIVEDNRINQMVINGMLEPLGHEIDVANDGEEALLKLEQKNYDLVFLDCQMPKLDGYQTTHLMLKEPARYGAPRIVALTASAREEDKNKCFAAGMHDFLSKPVRTNDLVKILNSMKPAFAKAA